MYIFSFCTCTYFFFLYLFLALFYLCIFNFYLIFFLICLLSLHHCQSLPFLRLVNALMSIVIIIIIISICLTIHSLHIPCTLFFTLPFTYSISSFTMHDLFHSSSPFTHIYTSSTFHSTDDTIYIICSFISNCFIIHETQIHSAAFRNIAFPIVFAHPFDSCFTSIHLTLTLLLRSVTAPLPHPFGLSVYLSLHLSRVRFLVPASDALAYHTLINGCPVFVMCPKVCLRST